VKRGLVVLLAALAPATAQAAPPTLSGEGFGASDPFGSSFGDEQQMSVLAVGSY
jgi:hypothetical protein